MFQRRKDDNDLKICTKKARPSAVIGQELVEESYVQQQTKGQNNAIRSR